MVKVVNDLPRLRHKISTQFSTKVWQNPQGNSLQFTQAYLKGKEREQCYNQVNLYSLQQIDDAIELLTQAKKQIVDSKIEFADGKLEGGVVEIRPRN